VYFWHKSTMDAPADPDYVHSYYTATAARTAPLAPLLGSASADVCVVGGGIAGCSAALSLAERGYRVVLLEAERIGWGASGRSGGQVIFGLSADQSDLERWIGIEDARRIWDMSLAGIELLRARIERHQIDCDWVSGEMFAAIKPRQWRQLQDWQQDLARRYHYTGTRLIEQRELSDTLATRRYIGALYDSTSGHLHPLRYTLGLSRAAVAAGAQLHEGSRVLKFERQAGRLTVHTAHGSVACNQLLLAGNAWLGGLVPAMQRKLMSIASYIIATEPLGEQQASALIRNNSAVSDMNWILDYFRRSADHRLLFGGRVNYSLLNLQAIAPATRRRMLNVFPQLRGVRIDYAWGCLLDITLNRAPHFGQLDPDVYFVQGFSGHGMALAGLAGELVAEAIAGSAERFDVFSRIPHRDFPGGLLLRRPALALAMLWYRLRDLL
jgi:gamma-glutamylputrescine oxidase